MKLMYWEATKTVTYNERLLRKIAYGTFNKLNENEIVDVGLSDHKCHLLEPLGLSVFSSLKQCFRRLQIQWTVIYQ